MIKLSVMVEKTIGLGCCKTVIPVGEYAISEFSLKENAVFLEKPQEWIPLCLCMWFIATDEHNHAVIFKV